MKSALRPWVTAGIALVGAGIIVVTAAGFAYGEEAPPGGPPFPDASVVSADIMGGSGTPIPQEGLNGQYMGDVFTRYLAPNFPGLNFDAPCPAAPCDINGLATPEGLYPLTAVKDLTVDVSVARGETILDQAIQQQLTQLGAGEELGVFGYSQSAIISSLEMTQLHNENPAAPVNFVLIGDQMNPNGGVFARFPGGPLFADNQLTFPSLGFTFYGATPDDLFPTTIYTLEYDGFADFPQNPINFLSDLNAVAGILYVHGTYPMLPQDQLDQAVQLETAGPTDTTYYMIPMLPGETLPLLRPVASIPVIGQPLADLLQPDLTQIVNLGYDNPANEGWSAGPANVATPFGLFPPLDQVITAIKNLGPGTEQGVQDFAGDLSHLSMPSLPDPSSLLGTALSPTAVDPGDVFNSLVTVVSNDYAVLLPTTDIAFGVATTLPLYDASLFLANLANPLDAVGLPVAADLALGTLAGGFELEVLLDAATGTVSALEGLIP